MNASAKRAGAQGKSVAACEKPEQLSISSRRRGAALIPQAFTLIELVGCLAVLAILASLTAPAVIKQIDHAAWVKENNDLSSISNALVLSAMRTHILPDASSGATGWGQAAANWLDKPVSQITSTPRNYQRALLIDPGLMTSGLNLPYSQKANVGLSNPPTNSRLILVSSISANPPVTSNEALSPQDFQAIWDTPQGALPQTSNVKWSGSGEDLCIQRINLEPLFFQLLLVNRFGDTNAAFSTDAYASTPVPPGGQGTSFYYLDSTVVNLWTNSDLVTRFLLKRNTSYIFENGMWQGQIMSRPPVLDPATQFALQAQIFLSAGANLNGASPVDVLSKMFNLMTDVSLTNNASLLSDSNNLITSAGSGANGLLYKKGGGGSN